MKNKYIIILLLIIAVIVVLRITWKNDGVVYVNRNQGFEIKLPSDWKFDIALDDISNSPRSFRASFGPDNLYLFIEINLPEEVTPVLPGSPVCRATGTVKIIYSDIATDIFSSTNSESENNSCTTNLLDKHSVNAQFCVDSMGRVYPATTEKGTGEYFFSCKNSQDSVYDIGLYCEGQEWAGKEGQKACSQLFDKLLSTFKVVK